MPVSFSFALRRSFLWGIAFSSLARAQPATKQTLNTDFRSFGEAGTHVSVYGSFVRHTDAFFVIQLADERILRIRLEPETAAFRNTARVNVDTYDAGDFLRVEVVSDGRDNLNASTIDLLRKGTPNDRAAIVQTPEWRRGNTLDAKAVDLTNDQRRLSTFIQTLPSHAALDQPAATATDSVLQKAREWARSYLSELPNFLAREDTEEFISMSKPPQWTPNGRVSAVLRHENGKDTYRDLVVDGEARPDFLQDSEAIPSYFDGKAWSTGELGGTIACLFSPYSKADFHYERSEGTATSRVYVYSFALPKLNSCTNVRRGSQVAYPASRGRIWISGGETSLLKLEVQYLDIPTAFPIDIVEREIEFGPVRIGATIHQMPVKSYYFGCMRGTYYCWMNRINLGGYRQFTAESTIQFDK